MVLLGRWKSIKPQKAPPLLHSLAPLVIDQPTLQSWSWTGRLRQPRGEDIGVFLSSSLFPATPRRPLGGSVLPGGGGTAPRLPGKRRRSWAGAAAPPMQPDSRARPPAPQLLAEHPSQLRAPHTPGAEDRSLSLIGFHQRYGIKITHIYV